MPQRTANSTVQPTDQEQTTAPAWTEQDLRDDPHANTEKADKVRGMFAAIARSYDLNNRLHALWLDQAWRAHAVRTADVKTGDRVLDVACGTGDLTMAFAKRSPAGEIVGVDFTPEMLDLARVKQDKLPRDAKGRVRYDWADAQELPFEDASFDVVSIAFGIRNVQQPERAIAEFARVLRPGGRLVILEFDTPPLAPVRWFNGFYAGTIMPITATMISRDRSGAYRYLPRSVSAFLSSDEMIALLGRVGFEGATHRRLTLGICACYRALRRH